MVFQNNLLKSVLFEAIKYSFIYSAGRGGRDHDNANSNKHTHRLTCIIYNTSEPVCVC